MAKKAKKELTPEERLEAALVPAKEWPYEVPGSWCWSYGYSFLLPMEVKKPVGDFFQYVDIDSVDNKRQLITEPKIVPVIEAPSRASRALHIGDTIFSMVRPYLKNIAYIDDTLSNAIASTGFYVCSPRKNVEPRFLYYMMTCPYVIDGLNTFMKGDNSPSIRKEELENFKYPIPPLSEQQRIVDRIESLFTKLDEAKEAAQAVIDGFEDRKAAILHKAFTGELTAEWRRKNDISFESWQDVFLKDIVKEFKYGSSEKSDYSNEGIPVLRIPNIGDGRIDFSDIKYFAESETDSSYYVHENDILIIRSNGSRDLVGKCALVPKLDREYAYASFLIRIMPSSLVRPDFLVMFLNSINARKQMFAKAKSSAGIHNINSKELGVISLLLPSLKEQETIVKIVEKIVNNEAWSIEMVEQILDQIDTMKKSILARAFRGELGTNDPNDEPAVELLKRILDTETV